jgi:hypothetical protein
MPTRSAVRELVETAAAKIGASVETVPSIIPTSDGWTIWRTKSASSVRVSRFSSRPRIDPDPVARPARGGSVGESAGGGEESGGGGDAEGGGEGDAEGVSTVSSALAID